MQRLHVFAVFGVFLLVVAGAALGAHSIPTWSETQTAETANLKWNDEIYQDGNGVYWMPYTDMTNRRMAVKTSTNGYNWSPGRTVGPDNVDIRPTRLHLGQTSDGTYWMTASAGDRIYYRNSSNGDTWSAAQVALDNTDRHYDFFIDDSDTFWIVTKIDGQPSVLRSTDMERWERIPLNVGDWRKAQITQGPNNGYWIVHSPSRPEPIYLMQSQNGEQWSDSRPIVDMPETTRLSSEFDYRDDRGFILFFGWRELQDEEAGEEAAEEEASLTQVGDDQEVAYTMSRTGHSWQPAQRVTNRSSMDRTPQLITDPDGTQVVYWNNPYNGGDLYKTTTDLETGAYGPIIQQHNRQ